MPVDQGLLALATTQYSTNLELLLQQEGSRLRMRVDEGYHIGKLASPINQIGAFKTQQPQGRYAPLQLVDANYVRRWVSPTFRDLAVPVDNFDLVQSLVDPKSKITQAAAAAFGRDIDDIIIAAATGTAQTGTEPGSLINETFDTTKFRIADTFGNGVTPIGLTVPKLLEAKRILTRYENNLDADMLCLVIGSQQEQDLLNQTTIVSTDFNDRPVLVDGKVTRFLGFEIVRSERLTETTPGATRGVLAFVKSGLYLGVWKDIEVFIDPRTDLSSRPWQVYTCLGVGATRTQPGKVIQILCADTTGAPITL